MDGVTCREDKEENMRKRVMAFFTIVVVPLSAYSQTPSQSRCSLTEASSPIVRGLRLGMTTDQLLALFPASAKRKETRDAVEKAMAATGNQPVYLSFDPSTDSAKEFAGVESISAGLYKGRVTDLSVVYSGATWRTTDEWLAKVSEAFKLPAAQDWTVGPSENPNKVLNCDGIEIEAAIQGGSASIRIRNTAHLRGIEERAAAAEERKRREIRP